MTTNCRPIKAIARQSVTRKPNEILTTAQIRMFFLLLCLLRTGCLGSTCRSLFAARPHALSHLLCDYLNNTQSNNGSLNCSAQRKTVYGWGNNSVLSRPQFNVFFGDLPFFCVIFLLCPHYITPFCPSRLDIAISYPTCRPYMPYVDLWTQSAHYASLTCVCVCVCV